jgi:uncharacterized membrane protein YqgA involved in biofilm formation
LRRPFAQCWRQFIQKKNFSFAVIARHNRRVTIATGAFLNALGILLGALFGLAWRKPVSARTQLFFRNALGAATIFFGLRLVWLSLDGTFLMCMKRIILALLVLVLGNLVGKVLALQKISNHFGRFAGNLITNSPHKMADGFNACAILFCAAPLGILGAVTNGLSSYFYFLAVKALMDALAMISFVKMFRWPAAMSAFPVFLFFGAITFACQFYAVPFLNSHDLTNSVNTVAGFIALAVAVVIFEIRKVELANYLPALVVAPLLAWLLNH